MSDKILRLPELVRITGLSASTIWRREKEGSFPRRRKISVRAVGWLDSEIEAWMTLRGREGEMALVES